MPHEGTCGGAGLCHHHDSKSEFSIFAWAYASLSAAAGTRGQRGRGGGGRGGARLWLFRAAGCRAVSGWRFVAHTLWAFLYERRMLHTRDSVQATACFSAVPGVTGKCLSSGGITAGRGWSPCARKESAGREGRLTATRRFLTPGCRQRGAAAGAHPFVDLRRLRQRLDRLARW